MGKIFTQLGMHFAWASPKYLLNEMSLEEIFMFYNYLVEELTGEKVEDKNNDTPDLKGFRNKYGNRIKTPNERGSN